MCSRRKSSHIRRGVAANLSTPVEVLDRLADDVDRRVRCEVADNRATTAGTLSKLLGASQSRVQQGHGQTLSETLLRGLIARNANTGADTLRVLSNEASLNVRATVAAHPNTTTDTREALAHDQHPHVVNVAVNYAKDAELLDRLTEGASLRMLMAVVHNPHTGAAALEKLASDKHSMVCRGVAAHPNTPTETLDVLAEDPALGVCVAVCTNPNYR